MSTLKITAATRRKAMELAEEVARRNGLSSHRDILNLPTRGRDVVVKARKEFVHVAFDTLPRMTSEKLAELMGCHHTTVLHHLGRTKKGRVVAERRNAT